MVYSTGLLLLPGFLLSLLSSTTRFHDCQYIYLGKLQALLEVIQNYHEAPIAYDDRRMSFTKDRDVLTKNLMVPCWNVENQPNNALYQEGRGVNL